MLRRFKSKLTKRKYVRPQIVVVGGTAETQEIANVFRLLREFDKISA